jgi:hypothetical protein
LISFRFGFVRESNEPWESGNPVFGFPLSHGGRASGLREGANRRLEEGIYAMPFGESAETRREITAAELGALLSGIDLSQAKRRKRYRLKSAEGA